MLNSSRVASFGREITTELRLLCGSNRGLDCRTVVASSRAPPVRDQGYRRMGRQEDNHESCMNVPGDGLLGNYERAP